MGGYSFIIYFNKREDNKMKLLYGTTNTAKISVMEKRLNKLGIELTGLDNLNSLIPDVPENGSTPLENARQKAEAYYRAFKVPVFSCDSGLYFDNVPDHIQPGVHVCTVNGKRLTDDGMVAYYSGLAHQYGNLTARYKNAICLILDNNHIYEAMESKRFIITEKQHKNKIMKKGFPLDSLSIDIKSGKYYYDLAEEELEQMDEEEGFVKFFEEIIKRGLIK